MVFSKYNIYGQIQDSKDYFLLNLLSGQADILDAENVKPLLENDVQKTDAEWLEKGYVTTAEDEDRLYKSAYLDFLDTRDEDEVQVFFVPWYDCNFGCSYCFQEEYTWKPEKIQEEIQQAFFRFLHEKLGDRKKYITLFGGEPLLPGEGRKAFLKKFLEQCRNENLDVAVVTNGYTLTEYLDVLQIANIREIQVTLDGTEEEHNKRRPLKGGKPSFEKIIAGIDEAIKRDISVNLRMVVDKENMPTLPGLADLAIERGWTKHPGFKTQLGRNYELHTCQADRDRIYSRASMYADLLKVIDEHPQVLEFHKPAYSITRFLSEEGELPKPLFDSCTGAKTEWALDMYGRVFSCTATVGKKGEELGSFWPALELDEETVDAWEERDVLAMDECRTCAVSLACGGGCASVAKNKNGGVQTPDCRPINELISMGMSLYFTNE